jgi:hypothetical protein
LVWVLAIGGLLAGGWSSARADTVTIGDTPLTSSAPTLNGFAQNVPVFQGDAGGGYVLASPVDGTIVSWSFLSGGALQGDQFVLRVLRPQDMTGTSWTAEATSPAQAVTSAGGVDALQGPFAVGIPVKTGDRIALEPLASGDNMPLENPAGVAGDGFRTFLAPFADGSSASIDPNSTGDFGQLVPIQATVVPVPINIGLPVISGTPTVGNTLSCSPGAWSGAPTFTYQWLADGLPLAGATAPTHVIAAGEAGHALTCAVTATNVGGTATATSAPATPLGPPFNSALPAISGTARRFDTLSATPGLWTGGVSAFAFQWLRCGTAAGGDCAPVAGATGSSYVLTFADIGFTMRFQVTATNGVGPTTVTSAPSAIVQQGVIEARLSITPSYLGISTEGYTCTGLSVRLDGSGSVSPDGIAAYKISEVSLAADGVYEEDVALGAFDNSLAFEAGDMPEAEIQSRIIASFDQPTVLTTFGWSRLKLPFSAQNPSGGYQSFAVDPVGILLTVTDSAGATATAYGVVGFAQFYSDQSRAGCPRMTGHIAPLVSVVALLHEASVVSNAAGKPSALGTKLSCAQSVTCRGAISIGFLSANAAAKHRTKAPVVLARSFFAIAPHHRLSIRAPLTSAGVRVLASLRPGTTRRLALTIMNVGPTGNQLTRTSTIVVRKPRR